MSWLNTEETMKDILMSTSRAEAVLLVLVHLRFLLLTTTVCEISNIIELFL